MKIPVLLLATSLLCPVAKADEVFLKSGGQLSGRVVSRTADKVEIDVGAGRVAVPASSVVRIEEGRSALQDYEERAGRVAPSDAGAMRHVWVDAATGQIVKASSIRKMRGHELELETAYGDYRETAGVRFARSIEIGVRGRPRRMRIEVESVEEPGARRFPVPDAEIGTSPPRALSGDLTWTGSRTRTRGSGARA